MRVSRFGRHGLVISRARRSSFSLAYGEILTDERHWLGWGLRLHTRTTAPVWIRCRPATRRRLEDRLRDYGVRIVDEYGAMITPTLADFEAELARDPVGLRQSSDDA